MSKVRKSLLVGPKVNVQENILHEHFEYLLENRNYSDKIAMVFRDEDESLHYKDYRALNNSANKIARGILKIVRSQKLQPNQENSWVVVCCMKHSMNLITTLLAIWKSGAAYVPISPNITEHPTSRVEHILKDVRPFLIICDDDYQDIETFKGTLVLKFSDIWKLTLAESIENIPRVHTLAGREENPLAVVLYTSGSSGNSKGVKMTHFNLNHYFQWQLRRYPFADNEKFSVFKTPLIFSDHIGEIWCPLFDGRTLCIIPQSISRNLHKFISTLEEFEIQRIVGIPSYFQALLMFVNILTENEDKKLLKKIRYWFSTGEFLSTRFVEEFFDYFDPKVTHQVLVNWYGATETSCEITCFEIKSLEEIKDSSEVPLGFPIDNSKIYIVDQHMKILSEGEIGEICVSGSVVTNGYVNYREGEHFIANPFESEEREFRFKIYSLSLNLNHMSSFIYKAFQYMFKTGDFGMIKNGLLFFRGRRDMQIKIRGHRVDVFEIEKYLMDLPYISNIAVVVHQSDQINQTMVAFVTLKKLSQSAYKITEEEIREDLLGNLPQHMIPQILILDKFPYLNTGKVDRQSLHKIFREKVKNERKRFNLKDLDGASPELSRNIRRFFSIISGIIGPGQLLDTISMKANFFSIGGNSFTAIETVAELKRNGFEIDIEKFKECKTLGEVFEKSNKLNRRASNVLVSPFRVNFKVEPIDEKQKSECIELLSKTLLQKAEIDKYLPELSVKHYSELLDRIWTFLVRRGFSFMVKNDEDEILGVALNYDAVDAPQFNVKNPLKLTLEFLKFAEHPFL